MCDFVFFDHSHLFVGKFVLYVCVALVHMILIIFCFSAMMSLLCGFGRIHWIFSRDKDPF